MSGAHRDDAQDHCPSQFQLDRLSADDATRDERIRLERHVASCATCKRGLAERADERARFVPNPRTLAQLTASAGRARRLRWLATSAPVALCAAAVLIAWRVRQPAIARRGSPKGGVEVSLFVERNGVPMPLDAGGRVRPDDRLQVAVSLPEPRYVAVYSVDGARAVSRYSPTDAAMVAIGPGIEQVLPNSTILDNVLGRETLVVFTCTGDHGDAELRARVAEGELAGCEIARYELDKVAP